MDRKAVKGPQVCRPTGLGIIGVQMSPNALLGGRMMRPNTTSRSIHPHHVYRIAMSEKSAPIKGRISETLFVG